MVLDSHSTSVVIHYGKIAVILIWTDTTVHCNKELNLFYNNNSSITNSLLLIKLDVNKIIYMIIYIALSSNTL